MTDMREQQGSGDLSERFAKPLGEVIQAHARLDFELQILIGTLLDIKNIEIAQALTGFIRDFESKTSLITQLFNIKFKHDELALERIKKIKSELDDTNSMRNSLVHGQHAGFSYPPLTMGVLKPKPRAQIFVQRSFHYSPEDVSRLAIRMRRLWIEISSLRQDINATSPGAVLESTRR